MQQYGKPSITVFGGTGFIGRNFATHAARQGARVVVCGRSPPADVAEDVKLPFAPLDATDLAATCHLLDETRPEAVVFGISRMYPRAVQNVDPSIALTELRALMNVIEAGRACGVKHIVFCSSGGAIYGDGPDPHRETDLCRPKSLYGQVKIQAEALINALCPGLGMSATILRIGNPYGPYQSPTGLHGVIPIFTYKMLAREPITVMGSLDAAKDYIFIDDVSAAIWFSIERQRTGTFNIGSGATTTVRTLIEKISGICAVQPAIEYREITAAEVRSFALDISQAEAGLAWHPVTGLDTGIRATKLWIEQNYMKQKVS